MNQDDSTKNDWFRNVDKEALARVSQLAVRLYNQWGYAIRSIKDPEVRKLMNDLARALAKANLEVNT